MATTDAAKSLDDPEFKAALQRLRRTDNLTNWYYLARTYLYLAAVIGGAVWFFELARADVISFWWTIPTALVAIVLVGAGQHQLSGLAHEGVHHILFRSRLPQRPGVRPADDVPAVQRDAPVPASSTSPTTSSSTTRTATRTSRSCTPAATGSTSRWRRATSCGRWRGRLWVPKLVRFMRVRARYNATGTDHNPYLIRGHKPSRTAVRIGLLYILLLIGTLTALFYVGDPVLLVAVPAALWAVVSVVYWRLPADKFIRTRLHPVVPARYMTILRLGFVTALFTTLALVTKLTGAPAVLYYVLLWVVPMFTSFSFFMILRQLVQHGNADRGWMTNTRTFLVGRAINFAVFPMGQDYHLPHHMYATIPHYRLRRLHALLMQYPEYREQGVEVKGYFIPAEYPKSAPTVLDVLGPEYAARHTRAVHIDDTVLDDDRFDDAEQIRQTGEQLRRAAG